MLGFVGSSVAAVAMSDAAYSSYHVWHVGTKVEVAAVAAFHRGHNCRPFDECVLCY